ncbi:hypothetical protein M9H77_19017 [Catharanthus roseus]|uniref:Uncharacterized protein n=1 Tax=Catharanthus roseus TaxID=4058 RepID=A0ACC0B942_CATRO|nr:hypothetical protein M9H77_19017 [Catharanthus roseus]
MLEEQGSSAKNRTPAQQALLNDPSSPPITWKYENLLVMHIRCLVLAKFIRTKKIIINRQHENSDQVYKAGESKSQPKVTIFSLDSFSPSNSSVNATKCRTSHWHPVS